MTCPLHRWSEMNDLGNGRFRCPRCGSDFLRGGTDSELCGELAEAVEVVDGQVHLSAIGRAALAQAEALVTLLRLAERGADLAVVLAARPQGLAGVRGPTVEEGLEVYRQAVEALRNGDQDQRDAATEALTAWEAESGWLFPRRPLRKLWEVHQVRRRPGSVVPVAEAGVWSTFLAQDACTLAARAHGGRASDYQATALGDAAMPVLSLDDAVRGITADLALRGVNLVELPGEKHEQLKGLHRAVHRAVEIEGLALLLGRGPRGIVDRTITSLLGALAPVALLQPGLGLRLTSRTAPLTELEELPGGPALYGRLSTTMLRELTRTR